MLLKQTGENNVSFLDLQSNILNILSNLFSSQLNARIHALYYSNINFKTRLDRFMEKVII